MSVVAFGQLAGLVEVAEPSEGLHGAVVVVGGVEHHSGFASSAAVSFVEFSSIGS